MTSRERIRELADGTRTAGEIAAEIGITRPRVCALAAEMGVPLRMGTPQSADTWPPEKVAELTRLWGEGVSITEIGRELGISRGAAVSKVHRIGLPKRKSPIEAKPRKPKPVARAVDVDIPAPIPDDDIVRTRPSALVDHQNRQGIHLSMLRGAGACRFPLWESRSDPLWMRYCGAEAPEGRSYCPHHEHRMHWSPVAGEAPDLEGDDADDAPPPVEEEDSDEAEVAA